VTEELGLDEGRGEGGEVQGDERPARRLREAPGRGVEGDVPREPDRARDQLLAGAGRAGDERRDVREARDEGAAVEARILGEDRLPDGRAEAPRRGGLAEEVPPATNRRNAASSPARRLLAFTRPVISARR
jgi:hypothetical protein